MNRLRTGQWAMLICAILIPLAFLTGQRVISPLIGKHFDGDNGLLVWLALAQIAFISLGLLLYWLRENLRLVYGIVEVVFALTVLSREALKMVAEIVVSIVALAPVGGGRLDISNQWVIFVLQFTAGLYVFVRGLDNIGQGMKGWPRAERLWGWFALKRVVKDAKAVPPESQPATAASHNEHDGLRGLA